MRTTCTSGHRTLAHGPVGSVQHCRDCGVLSLHLGATTIRLDPASAEALWATLGHALHVLHELGEAPSPRAAVGEA